MAYTFEELKHKTIAELREIAKGVDNTKPSRLHPDEQGPPDCVSRQSARHPNTSITQ
jgi:hypothetical protein